MFLLDNISIRFGIKLYQIFVCIQTVPLYCRSVSVLLRRSLYVVLSHENQPNIIEALKSASPYLDDLLNIDNACFEEMLDKVYLEEFQLKKIVLTSTNLVLY